MSTRAKPRTCCPTHRDTCQFGRDHVWSGPFLLDGGRDTEAGKWSQPGDLKCANCSGVCVADRDSVTARDMVSVIAKVIADNSVVIHDHPDYGEMTASTLTPDEMARAVLAAISEAGAVEWGVAGPNGYVNEYETEADARLQIATRNYLTLWNRIAATDWQRAE